MQNKEFMNLPQMFIALNNTIIPIKIPASAGRVFLLTIALEFSGAHGVALAQGEDEQPQRNQGNAN
jgi:hypothetical protein